VTETERVGLHDVIWLGASVLIALCLIAAVFVALEK